MVIPCSTCGLWESIEGDLYCSWCGATLIDLGLTIDNDYLYVGDPKTTLKLMITHSGVWGAVRIESVTTDQPWLTIKSDHQARSLPGKSLRQGEFIELTLEADLAALPDDYHVANISVVSNVGPRAVSFEAVPRPTLDKVSTGGEHTIWLDNLPEEKLTGYLAISSGVVTIETLTTDVDWAEVQATNQTIPCRLDARRAKRLEFEFKIDEAQLLQEILAKGEKFPAERSGNLVMKFGDMEAERSWPFYVKCLLPPALIIPEAEKPVEVLAFMGKQTEFGLTLENGNQGARGHAELEILKIDYDEKWLRPINPIVYPLVIASGQFQHLTFEIDVDKLSLGSHQAKLIFFTNIAGPAKQQDVFIELEVRELPPFDGVVAIDFGTTNSCCRYITARGREEFVLLGEGKDRNRITSSSILYKNILENGRKHYEIGNLAYLYSMSGAPLSARCTVTQVKRLLGTDRRYQIRFQDEPAREEVYTPREVTADILRRILEQAEDAVGARITACTVTHPSRFSVRQLNELKAAIVSGGVDEEAITLVHEPIGAALDFIRREPARTKYKEYHVMVFDFGGGTIDITLLKVVNEPQSGRRMIYVKPDVLGVTGDPHFGGEDVTEGVLNFMQATCETNLTLKFEKATKCLVPIKEEQFGNPLYKTLARENRSRLRARAEASKIAISTYGDEHIEMLEKLLAEKGSGPQKALASGLRAKLTDKFKLNVIVDNETKESEFNHKEVSPKTELIGSLLRSKLIEAVEMMKQLAKKNKVAAPNVILLSGMSSAFPIVREVISGAFPDSSVEMPSDLKGCVVKGACLLAEDEPAEGVSVKFEAGKCLSAMTSSLGISVRRESGRRFKKAIEAGEPIGREGVRGAIDRDVEFTRRARITIYENTGFGDNLVDANGKDNPNITLLKTFKLESKLGEWERAHNRQISEPEIANSTIELEVTSNLKVKLRARIPGIDEPLEFEEVEYIGG
jgi:molecular chaperone DnaK (HSP70)